MKNEHFNLEKAVVDHCVVTRQGRKIYWIKANKRAFFPYICSADGQEHGVLVRTDDGNVTLLVNVDFVPNLFGVKKTGIGSTTDWIVRTILQDEIAATF